MTGLIPFAGKSFFEIGAADGKLLNMIAKSGARETCGSEYNRHMRSLALRRYGIALSDQPIEKTARTWDAVILSHVIEHFPDIRSTLAVIRKAIPNGHIFVEVPLSPHPDRSSSEDVRHFCQTAHTYNFRPKSLRVLFERNGFDIVSLTRWIVNVSGAPDTPAHRMARETLQSGRRPVIRALPKIISFLLRGCLAPGKSFREIPLDAPWTGKGDNLRVIARPRS
jgi:hypothetical protein